MTSTPLRMTVPALGSIMPQVMRKLVVLPAPLGPSRPTISPRLDPEVDACRTTRRRPYSFTNPWTSNIGPLLRLP